MVVPSLRGGGGEQIVSKEELYGGGNRKEEETFGMESCINVSLKKLGKRVDEMSERIDKLSKTFDEGFSRVKLSELRKMMEGTIRISMKEKHKNIRMSWESSKLSGDTTHAHSDEDVQEEFAEGEEERIPTAENGEGVGTPVPRNQEPRNNMEQRSSMDYQTYCEMSIVWGHHQSFPNTGEEGRGTHTMEEAMCCGLTRRVRRRGDDGWKRFIGAASEGRRATERDHSTGEMPTRLWTHQSLATIGVG